jgi:predicted amidophosphoribosyltransferase
VPLRVVSFCSYQTGIALSWRPADHNAHDFIRAIKGRDIKEYAWVRVNGAWRRFDNTNRQSVVDWFGEMAAAYLRTLGLREKFVLVPVPASASASWSSGLTPTAQLASAVAAACGGGTTVMDVLRWTRPVRSASACNGPRHPSTLLKQLTSTAAFGATSVILVDDVVASGGHLRACAALLCRRGAAVLMALCAGRADGKCDGDPFSIRVEEIPDYSP